MNIQQRYFLSFIESNEGRRNKPYNDSNGHPTIGVGHKILNTDKFNNEISDEEIDELFCNDIEEHIERTKKLFPKFDSYPLYIQASLLDGVYRGDLSGSPKTILLINQDEWSDASIEYLNNKEYQLSKHYKTGVWKRMLLNSYHFKCFGATIIF